MADWLLYFLICSIWGSTWAVIKVGLVGVPPFLGAGLRFVLAAAVLGGLAWIKRARPRLGREDLISIWSAGLLGFTGVYALVYWAEQHIPSGLTAILFSCMPLGVAVLSHFWTKGERLTPRKTIGILIGMAGTAILFWPGKKISIQQAGAMAAVLLSGCLAAANMVVLKKFSKKTDIYLLNALGMGIGAVGQLLLSAAFESYASLAWSPSNVLAIVYLSLFGSVAAFLAYFRLIHRMPATMLSTSTLSVSVVAVLLGWVFMGEAVTSRALAGIVTVLAGVGLVLLAPEGEPFPVPEA